MKTHLSKKKPKLLPNPLSHGRPPLLVALNESTLLMLVIKAYQTFCNAQQQQ